MSHHSDFAMGPLVAILAESHAALVPDSVQQSLQSFQGEHTYTAQAYSPPFDFARRNYTTWMSSNLSIGAISFDQAAVGGSATNQEAWAPAVIQWYHGAGSEVGYLVVSSPPTPQPISPQPISPQPISPQPIPPRPH